MLEGGCFCGRVRYQVSGTPFHSTVCHCVDCRRASGAPCFAWFSVRRDEIRIVAGTPTRYSSSSAVERTFCADCGTQLSWQSASLPDEIDIATATLDTPQLVPPRDHTWTSQKLPWLAIADGLPQIAGLRVDD